MERPLVRRRRPARSCEQCRSRKIKCDRNDPCARCVSAETRCTYKVYRDDAISRQQHEQNGSWHARSKPLAPTPSSLDQAPSTSINKPTGEHSGDTSTVRPIVGQSDTPRIQDRTVVCSPGGVLDKEVDIRDLVQRVQRLEKTLLPGHNHEISVTEGVQGTQPGIQGSSQISLNKTRTMRWSHHVGMVDEFDLVVACYAKAIGCGNPDDTTFGGNETRALTTEMGELLNKCKNLAKKMKVGRPSRSLSGCESNLASPSREVADRMVNLYFESFESVHRIVHVPTFWIEYQKYWDRPETVTIGQRLKILLVIGLGSSLCDYGDTDLVFRNMVHRWVYAAQTWLSGPLEKDSLDITGIKVHCLTIQARQIFSIGGDLVWMSMGSLVHRAMQIGLHRDPKYLPKMSVLQAELRRRLWATILELAVQASLDSAMPPRISFDEFDTEPPSNNNDEEMNESTFSLKPHTRSTFTTTSMQLLLLDSLPIRLRILQVVNGLHSEIVYSDAIDMSNKITDAYRACGQFAKENKNAGVTPFHQNHLDYLVRRFLIPLHCSFASQARTNPLFYYSLKINVDTAMAIISPMPDDKFSHLMAIGGGLFREGIRYAVSIISQELIAQVQAQHLERGLRRISPYTELLKRTVQDMITLSADRIRLGETNIKSHMFLSMIMAHVQAVEEDRSCELSIAQGGRDSIAFCYSLLQARAEAATSESPAVTDISTTDFGGVEDLYQMDFDFDFFLPHSDFS